MNALNICKLSLLLLLSPLVQFPEPSASSEPHRRVVPRAAFMDNPMWGPLRVSFHQHQLLFGGPEGLLDFGVSPVETPAPVMGFYQ